MFNVWCANATKSSLFHFIFYTYPLKCRDFLGKENRECCWILSTSIVLSEILYEEIVHTVLVNISIFHLIEWFWKLIFLLSIFRQRFVSLNHNTNCIRRISCMLRLDKFVVLSLVSVYQYLLFETSSSLGILGEAANAFNCQQDKCFISSHFSAREELNFRAKTVVSCSFTWMCRTENMANNCHWFAL